MSKKPSAPALDAVHDLISSLEGAVEVELKKLSAYTRTEAQHDEVSEQIQDVLDRLNTIKSLVMTPLFNEYIVTHGNLRVNDLSDLALKYGLVPSFKLAPLHPDANVSEEVVTEMTEFRLGTLVVPTGKDFEFDGRRYHDAVVACLSPLVLVSRDGTARWDRSVDPSFLRVVGMASEGIIFRTQQCLTDEERASIVTVLTLR